MLTQRWCWADVWYKEAIVGGPPPMLPHTHTNALTAGGPFPKNYRLTRAISVRALQLPRAPDSPHRPGGTRNEESYKTPESVFSRNNVWDWCSWIITDESPAPSPLIMHDLTRRHATFSRHLPGVFTVWKALINLLEKCASEGLVLLFQVSRHRIHFVQWWYSKH